MIQTLDYLSRELSGLDRLAFAAEEMVKILHTDWPRHDAEVQEKVTNNIHAEIAEHTEVDVR